MKATTDPQIRQAMEDERAWLIAQWRCMARENLRLRFTDLARFCEARASDLEWEAVR